MQRIDNRLHWAALVLAEELDFERAAQRLELSASELRNQIDELENILSLRLFVPDSDPVQMTDSGQHYIALLRKSSLF